MTEGDVGHEDLGGAPVADPPPPGAPGIAPLTVPGPGGLPAAAPGVAPGGVPSSLPGAVPVAVPVAGTPQDVVRAVVEAPPRVLDLVVAEDETTTRSALVALLDMEEDLRVVADVADGEQALAAVARYRPAVLVVDLEMPRLDGVEVCRRLAEAPAGNPPTRVIVLTRYARPGALRRALEARAHGFVTKSTPVQRVAEIVRQVADGQRFIDPQIAAIALTEEACPLSGRELDVLRAALPGGTVNDIAAELHLARGTVRNYLSSAMTTLGARTRHEAAQMALREGWI